MIYDQTWHTVFQRCTWNTFSKDFETPKYWRLWTLDTSKKRVWSDAKVRILDIPEQNVQGEEDR